MRTSLCCRSRFMAAVVYCLLCWSSAPVFAALRDALPTTASADHWRQAAQYRQEAERVQQVIRRYQILKEIYTTGSRGISPGFNPLGRREMVERVQRVIQYFTQEEHDLEQRAADEEQLAQHTHPLRTR